ncbi:hypothetical protein BGZ94_005633 [Podila epigama]|nr:hypothetical protein BGZ94_005633 [Podila epigama]
MTLVKKAHILDIPEILHAVALHLDSASLVASLQVSHHWFTTCAPVVWNHLSAQDWNCNNGRRHDSAWSPGALLAAQNLAPTSPSTNSHPMCSKWSYAQLVRSLEYQTRLVQQQQWQMPSSSTSPRCSHSSVTHSSSNPDFTKQSAQESLVLCSSSALTSILQSCTNLQSLCLHADSFANGDIGIPFETLKTIRHLQFLQTLDLHLNNVIYNHGHHCRTNNNSLAAPTTTNTPWVATRQLLIQELIHPCAQLKQLVLRGTAFKFMTPNMDHDQEESTSDSPSTLNTTHDIVPTMSMPSLQHLSLDLPHTSGSGITEPELTYLLQQCPNLESLSLLSGLTWEWSNDFLQTTMVTTCPNLSSFSITGQPFNALAISQERLTTFLRTVFSSSSSSSFLANQHHQQCSRPKLGQLTQLVVRACHLGDSTLEALLEVAPGLEHLDISQTRGHSLTTQGLWDYLTHKGSRHLKSLDAEGVWLQTDFIKQLFLAHAFNQRQQAITTATATMRVPRLHWACQDSLERLVIGFSNTPSPAQPTLPTTTMLPTGTIDYSNNNLDNLIIESAPSRPFSWYMFRHISTLTQLQHLQFSQTCLNLNTHQDGQEGISSINGGLDLLQSLKHLRVFSIESCTYASPLSVLHWMASSDHWPMLDTFYINPPGSSRERQIKSWLEQSGRHNTLCVTSLQQQKHEEYNMMPSW